MEKKEALRKSTRVSGSGGVMLALRPEDAIRVRAERVRALRIGRECGFFPSGCGGLSAEPVAGRMPGRTSEPEAERGME